MLEKILDSCKYVVDKSEHVKINYDKLDLLISGIDCNNLKHWLSSNPYNLTDLNVSDIINLMLIFESIDYSFWGAPKWTINTDSGSKDGAEALLYVLLKYVKDNSLTALQKISLDEFRDVLKGNVEIPLLEDRYNTLAAINKIVRQKMNGDFYNYIKDVTSDIELFEIIINNFPTFKDERIYKGQKIYFYKLAQLLTSDILHLRESLEGIEVCYSNLLGCADYKIPQILRAIGIIEYDKELANVIDNKIEIELSSEYEVEIRASMLIVINYIKEKKGNVNSIDINDYLFLSSKKIKDKVKPYHLCRNSNY